MRSAQYEPIYRETNSAFPLPSINQIEPNRFLRLILVYKIVSQVPFG
jgi:hypothetical protein